MLDLHLSLKLIYTLQGTNISHLGKRKIIFKRDFLMGYVSSQEGIYIYPSNRRCLRSQWNRPGALGWRLEKFNVDDGTESTHDVREESCRSVLHANALVFLWLILMRYPFYFDSTPNKHAFLTLYDSTSNKHAFLSIYRSIYLSIWYCFKVLASCIFQWWIFFSYLRP